jgi:uncharacterized membrane protein
VIDRFGDPGRRGTGRLLARRPVARPLTAIAWASGCATVLVQILYSVAEPGRRTPFTILTVVAFALASVSDTWARGGARAAGVLVVVAGGGGLLAEVVGAHTGFPFGAYAYTDALGPSLAGVPVVVPLAWMMMAWPAFLVGALLATRWSAVVVATFALAVWDVFLDPQMVDAGYWIWADPKPSLPGVDGIPLTNFAGWLLVAGVVQVVLHRAIPASSVVPGVAHGPAPVLYLWTWISSVWAHLAFFGRPSVAVVGGALMALVAVPYAVKLLRARR